MKLNSEFLTNGKLENEGVWRDLGHGMSVKVARWGNPAAEKIRKRLAAPYGRGGMANNLPSDIAENITVQVMAKAILLDWKGPILLDDAGKAVPYSLETAVFALSPNADGSQNNLRDRVASIALDMQQFQVEEEDAAAKNS